MAVGLQLTFLSLLGVSLLKEVLGFYPRGCEYRNRGMDLRCENSNLTNFIVSNTTNTSIHSIHLSGNLLKSFNGTEVSKIYPNIFMLDSKDNNLEYVKNETLKGFLQLKLLDMSHNYITEIDIDAFINLMTLKMLHVRNNRIRIVKDIWFRNLFELEEIDLRYNLIDSFVPSYFRWPENLKTLLLQGNRFHVVPPLPRNPFLVDLSYNKIDCSCQRHGQEKVNKDVLFKVIVTCNEISTEKWRKMYWENPFCTFPTVRVEYKEFDDIYIVKCTGDGFPLPKVFYKHQGQVVATSLRNFQVMYGIINDTNVTCKATNPVGNSESHLMRNDEQEEDDTSISVNSNNISDNSQEDITSCKCFVLSLGYYITMFISCVFTFSALVVSLYIFSISFRQLESPDNDPEPKNYKTGT